MIQADLHIHTTYSPDAEINVETIIDELYAHPSIKAIAITDHNTVEGYFKARQLATAYQDILIIPGVELSTTQGDIIILGTAEMPPRPWTPETIIDYAKQTSSITIAAHPYRPYGLGDSARNYALNAIETLNGISAPQVNKMARKPRQNNEPAKRSRKRRTQPNRTMDSLQRNPSFAGHRRNPESHKTRFSQTSCSRKVNTFLKQRKTS